MDLNDPETWRWIWLAAVVFFAMGELTVPGSFFMISFAIGAAVADGLAFSGVSASLQWLSFVVVSGAALAVLVPIGRRMDRSGAQSNVGATRWLGRTGTVLTEIPGGPHETGLVRVEREEWRAESADGRSFAVGEHVAVLRVDGTRLIVGPDTAAPPAATGPGAAESEPGA